MNGTTAVLLVLAVETICGLGVLALLGVARSGRELLRRAGLAPLTGMAWAGVTGATLATAGTRLSLLGLLGLTALTWAAGASRLRLSPASVGSSSHPPTGAIEKALAGASLLATAIICGAALEAFRDKPLADYDGWAMWGMKARAIAVLGAADPDVFAGGAYERLHVEYPLLLPSLHALPLQAADGYDSNTVILSCLAIGAAGLLALWSALRDRVRPALLLGFVAAIAAMPAFFGQLGTGYADVPLAVVVAAGVAASARWLLEDVGAWLALASLFLAAAALTKNEGLLFATAACVALALAARGRRRQALVPSGVVALAYAPWQLYTAVHRLERPDFDLSSSFDIPLVVDRLDRAPVAVRQLLEEALEPRRFGLLVLLGVAAALLSLRFGHRGLGAFAVGFAVLCLAGLTWIYVLTPYELDVYLPTHSDRVVMAPILGLAVLAPLMLEESARSRGPGREGAVGKHR